MTAEHTQGRAESTGNGIHIGMRCLATTHMEPPEQRQADARRIAAIWNACQGISTEDLERAKQVGLIRSVYAKSAALRQRDDLLTALQRLLASDAGIAAATDDELTAAVADTDAEALEREQAAAVLQARQAIKAIGDTACLNPTPTA